MSLRRFLFLSLISLVSCGTAPTINSASAPSYTTSVEKGSVVTELPTEIDGIPIVTSYPNPQDVEGGRVVTELPTEIDGIPILPAAMKSQGGFDDVAWQPVLNKPMRRINQVEQMTTDICQSYPTRKYYGYYTTYLYQLWQRIDPTTSDIVFQYREFSRTSGRYLCL